MSKKNTKLTVNAILKIWSLIEADRTDYSVEDLINNPPQTDFLRLESVFARHNPFKDLESFFVLLHKIYCESKDKKTVLSIKNIFLATIFLSFSIVCKVCVSFWIIGGPIHSEVAAIFSEETLKYFKIFFNTTRFDFLTSKLPNMGSN